MWFDCNTFFGNWPFRELPAATDLKRFREETWRNGIVHCWVSPMEAFFHLDPVADNERLGERLAEIDGAKLLPVIHPFVRGDSWIGRPGVAPGCRLAPGCHRFRLNDPALDRWIADLDPACRIIVVTLRLIDRRSHAGAFLSDETPIEDLFGLAERHPDRRFLATGATTGEIIREPERFPNLFYETSFIDGLDGVAKAFAATGGRIVFGSASPLFYSLAARRKVEFCSLGTEEINRIAAGSLIFEDTPEFSSEHSL